MPPGSSVLVNIHNEALGDFDVSFETLGFLLRGVDSSRMLFNLPAMMDADLSRITLPGTLLAPNTRLTTTGAMVDGQVVGRGLVADQSRFPINPYQGRLCPGAGPPDPGPTSCEVTYDVTHAWPGGFQARLDFTLTGGAALSGWTLEVDLDTSLSSLSGWNAQWSGGGANYQALSYSWNAEVAVGETVSGLGFNASGGVAQLTAVRLNGVPCTLSP